jgi:multicomponent Na+:H+ antiporter subunit B
MVLGFHFFLRGHNAPGGGFIAGLIVAVAALLARMFRDRRLLTLPGERLIPLGLLLAVCTGVIPMLFGHNFLKSGFGYLTLPFVGEVEWASAVMFDAGVFLVVVGTTLTIIDLLAEDVVSLRSSEDGRNGEAR